MTGRLFIVAFAALPWSVLIGAAVYICRRYRILGVGLEVSPGGEARRQRDSAADTAENSNKGGKSPN